MSYSPQLSYFLDRLSGFSTNIFRLEPQGSNSAKANNIIRITLPANSLVNFRTFALHFNAAITSANDEGRLPNKIDSLVERVEVTFGGVQVSAGNNMYNVLRHAKDALMGDSTDPILGHPEVVRAESYHITSGIASNKEVAAPYVIDKWEGFLGTVEPKIVDLSLLPECVVSIYLAENAVCIDAAGTALATTASTGFDISAASPAPVYELTNIYATIETIGLADGTYDSMISQMMSQVGYLELPFKQYISFQDTTANNMRFSVATQSLDRLWLVHRDTAYNTAGGAVSVTGHKVSGAFVDDVAGQTAADIDIGIPQFDIGGSLDYNKEKYISKYFNFSEPAGGVSKHQLQLNGALFPQYQASVEDMFQISKQSVLGGRHQMKYGLRTMRDNYAVFCVRLNLCDSEFSRQLSGLDTRSINLSGFYNMYGVTGGGKSVNVFVECSSSLRIGPNLQIEVLQ
jgi:hypothetical protein